MSDVSMNITFGIDLGDNIRELEKAVDKALGENTWENLGSEEAFHMLMTKELGIKECSLEDREARSRDYYTWQRKRNESIKEHGIGLTVYGTSDDTCYILRVKDKYIGSAGNRGSVTTDFLEVSNEDQVKLIQFCTKYGITLREPKWYVNSYEYT